jgi:hypothetical protein
MNQQIAVRSDGAIAVATSTVDGWGYGYLIDANGERFEWPSPLASLLGQGSWKPIDGFDLSTITPPSEFPDAISKAYQRKYGSRTEAARAAANARWGNRSGYSQGIKTSVRRTPEQAPRAKHDDDIDPLTTIVDKILTESVDPYDANAVKIAAAEGPVSLVAVHATTNWSPDLIFQGDPRGGGTLGTGIYGNLITETGMIDQRYSYQSRGRQALVRLDFKKALVVDENIDDKVDDKYGIRRFMSPIEKAVASHLYKQDLPKTEFEKQFEAATDRSDPYSSPPSVPFLKKQGYDGIILVDSPKHEAVVFSSKQVKVVDPTLTVAERKLVYAVGAGNKVTKAVGHAFDGRDFDLVSIEDLISEPITKMSRSEAGRYAANVRWGNRTKAVPSIDAASLSRGQKITIEGKQLGNLTVNMVDTGLDGDLRNVSIPGYALFDGANMGLRREQMPQVPSRAKPQFLSEMRLKGVRVAAQSVDPRTLKPSQTDVSAALTGKVLKMMRDGSFHDSPAGRILVSKDGFVIDGHHRWAAASAYAFDVPGARLPIIRVDLNAADLISAAREFGAREGIKTLGFGETLKKAARWLFGS